MRGHLRTHDMRAWARSYLTALDDTGVVAAVLNDG